MDGQLLSETFVELTDTLVADFDIIDFLQLLTGRSAALQTALNNRVVIEQAKGKLAERFGLDMDQAFGMLRDHARTRNLRLSELARDFVHGTHNITGPAAERRDRGATGGTQG